MIKLQDLKKILYSSKNHWSRFSIWRSLRLKPSSVFTANLLTIPSPKNLFICPTNYVRSFMFSAFITNFSWPFICSVSCICAYLNAFQFHIFTIHQTLILHQPFSTMCNALIFTDLDSSPMILKDFSETTYVDTLPRVRNVIIQSLPPMLMLTISPFLTFIQTLMFAVVELSEYTLTFVTFIIFGR